jgi:hypothetical protein
MAQIEFISAVNNINAGQSVPEVSIIENFFFTTHTTSPKLYSVITALYKGWAPVVRSRGIQAMAQHSATMARRTFLTLLRIQVPHLE